MKTSFLLVTKVVILLALLSSLLMTQKSGQSMQIQYGVVVASRYVQEKPAICKTQGNVLMAGPGMDDQDANAGKNML